MVSKRQKEILKFIKKYVSKYGYSPSLEEIAKNFGLSSLSTIHYHLTKLEGEGLISRYDYLPRSIQLENQTSIQFLQIPLVGLIAAGEPIEALEEPETISVSKSMLSSSGNHYALKVKGDSMIEEGIFDGDTVIIKKQDIAENGEVVVALINGNEATLKKIYREGGKFKLQPANPRFKPIYTKELLIQGKVTGVLRALESKSEIPNSIDLFSNKLEEQYSEKVPYPYRKQLGQFFTPFDVAELMSTWILRNKPKTILDPACGTCVFERSVFKLSKDPIRVDAYDIDKKMIAICEKVAPALGTLKTQLIQEDFLLSNWDKNYDAIICNPPYLKHHHIKDKEKYIALFREKAKLPFSLNTNAYSLFTIKALSQLSSGGRMAFITPSEFLNSNYGVEVKRFLLQSKKWRYLIIFDFKMSVFSNATTTACITLFENNPSSNEQLTLIKVNNENGLKDVKEIIGKKTTKALSTPSIEVFSKFFKELDPNTKWKQYFEKQHQSSLLVPFTKYAKVMRGIATGANSYFTFTKSELEKFDIDQKYVTPCITKAIQAPRNIFTKDDFRKSIRDNKKSFLLYANGQTLSLSLKNYIKTGEEKGIDKKYLTSHRDPWWSSEERLPAPILITVFGRKGLRLVRNETQARNLTCFHSIYLTAIGGKYIDLMMAYLVSDLAQEVLSAEKREYGNGLEKIEPNDVNKGLIVDFERISTKTAKNIRKLYKEWRQGVINDKDSSRITLRQIDQIYRRLINQYKGKPTRNINNEQLSIQFA